ncbi:MAG TPA: DUF1592 domain-containing protein [Polyangia bacterium]|nr:DUF1592 domain-containing protein [Polyangia bacterium]
MKSSWMAALATVATIGCGAQPLQLGGEGSGGATTPIGTAGTTGVADATGSAGTTGATGAAGATGTAGSTGFSMSPSGTAGAPGSGLPISDAELARRLARFIWAAPPDADLLNRIALSAPQTRQDVDFIAATMLKDPRARDGATVFYRKWLDLDQFATVTKDPALFPEFTPALRDDMIGEALQFALYVTFDGDGRFPTLFTAEFSFLDAPLAAIYGVDGVTGAERVLTMLDPDQRSGVLTLPAVLGNVYNSDLPPVTARGRFAYGLEVGNFLAGPTMVPMIPPTATQTTRDWLASLLQAATCAACHSRLDPVGLAFLNYDALGRFSTTERGMPVDDTGSWSYDGGTSSMTFHGARGLADIFASSTDARDGFVGQWLALAVGVVNDTTSLQQAIDAFVANNLDIPSLIAAVTTTDAFLAP